MLTVLVIMLILFSTGLVITVPVALATPADWEANRRKFNKFFQTWVTLVLIIGIADFSASTA